jgi:trans-aconitate methyltransferase
MRIPEPSALMIDEDQCDAYNTSLHAHEFNDYIQWYKEYVGVTNGTLIDLGSGPCNFVIALCLEFPNLKVVCYEDSEIMIQIAKRNIKNNNLTDRITIVKDNLMNASGKYEPVLLNRVLHHIDDTVSLWKLVNNLSNKLLAVDLMRYDDSAMLEKFINKIKSFFDFRYVTDTENSFKAAYSYNEVVEQVKLYGYIVKPIVNSFDDVHYGKFLVYHSK